MLDPLKTATAKQFSILNGLSDQQIASIAASSSLYWLFHEAGYSDAWIAADSVAWQQLQQKIRITLPVVMVAIFLVGMTEWRARLTSGVYLTSFAAADYDA